MGGPRYTVPLTTVASGSLTAVTSALRPHCGEYGRGGRLGLATTKQGKPIAVQALARIRALEAENAELKAKVQSRPKPY